MMNLSIWKKPEKVRYDGERKIKLLNETVAIHMHYTMDLDGITEHAKFKQDLLALLRAYDASSIRSEDDIKTMEEYDNDANRSKYQKAEDVVIPIGKSIMEVDDDEPL